MCKTFYQHCIFVPFVFPNCAIKLLFFSEGSIALDYELDFDGSQDLNEASVADHIRQIWRDFVTMKAAQDPQLNATFYELLGGAIDLDSITVSAIKGWFDSHNSHKCFDCAKCT